MRVLERYPDFRGAVLRCCLASSGLEIAIPHLLPLVTEVLRLPQCGYGVLLGAFGLGGSLAGSSRRSPSAPLRSLAS